ncbi:hypothetical protein P2H44_14025 [Albimonas sp. CAU 1670]|uniref:hypothetical protein n=1 Tax=Albimonas sp. CAU 1670 TaxID=3032599 RepID=UPI0023DBA8C6|nr:hypothetical protein [Albimonas sp. CAU 1670]MDF2233674.1 hypothetical protein [Albimonas sp. CAU 1670]
MSDDPRRIPVIIGVGQVNDRPEDPLQGLDSLGLMVEALRRADADAGGGWLARLGSIAIVDQISFPGLTDLADKAAEALGAAPAHRKVTAGPMGDGPVTLLAEAANLIGAGEVEVAAVTGGEALRTAARRAAAQGAGDANASRASSERRSKGMLRARYGLTAPVDVYPLYENGCRAAWGQTLAEGQAESAEIWSLMSKVAAENPDAWLRKPLEPADILSPEGGNRPIAFPYSKLMVANGSVNQGAGFIVASLAAAREAGIPDDRLVHIGLSARAQEDADVLRRDRYDRTATIEVSIRKTLEKNKVSARDLDAVELYSCFPCVPKMARRVLGWPADKPATVYGGLTFGGGPIGNVMSHAIAAMVGRIRDGAKLGLVFANGGHATYSCTVVLGRERIPGAVFPASFDHQADADAIREEVPELVEDYAGPATVETYTVFYGRDGAPRNGVIVARTQDGRRTVATVPAGDAAAIAWLTDGAEEPVGAAGEIVPGTEPAPDGGAPLQVWKRAG